MAPRGTPGLLFNQSYIYRYGTAISIDSKLVTGTQEASQQGRKLDNILWDLSDACITSLISFIEYCIYTYLHTNLTLFSTIATAASLPGLAKSSSPYFSANRNQSRKIGDLVRRVTLLVVIDEDIICFWNGIDLEDLVGIAAALPADTGSLLELLSVEEVKRKSLRVKLGQSRAWHMIILPEGMRVEHSCRPNPRFSFNAEKLSLEIHAARLIAPGDAITISYIDEIATHAQRLQSLHTHYTHHTYSCTLCSSLSQNSDAQITALLTLQSALQNLRPDITRKYPATTHDALEVVERYREEGLDARMREAWLLAAWRFCIWEDEEGTMEFMGKVLEMEGEWWGGVGEGKGWKRDVGEGGDRFEGELVLGIGRVRE